MQTFRRLFRLLPCLDCLLLVLPFSALAQSSAPPAIPAPMQPEAQDALKRGVIAAQQQEWLIAIQSFQEARKSAANAPILFYNLGLAESKLPGRELRAIAWFGAYLAATPNAPNAAAVNDAIVALQIKNQGNLNRLIETAQNMKVPEDPNSPGFEKNHHLEGVANLRAEAGDFQTALKMVELLNDHNSKGMVLMEIARSQASAEDIAGAFQSAERIQDPMWKSEALCEIAIGQADLGDIAGAQKTVASAIKASDQTDQFLKSGTLESIWRAQYSIAEAQFRAGDIAGAVTTAEGEPGYKQEAIAEAETKAGDCAGAQKTADLIHDAKDKHDAQFFINLYKDGCSKSNSTSTQRAAPVLKASDWLEKLDDNNQSNRCPLNTDPFLDLAGYLTAQHSDDPGTLFYALYNTAEKIAKARNIINRMLKQQVKQARVGALDDDFDVHKSGDTPHVPPPPPSH